MSLPEIYTNLRGGVIYAAADVAPTTVRTWPLAIGTPRMGGHPRYDLTDAVILHLMKVLALEGGMPPKRAAFILNDNRATLGAVIQAICSKHRASGRWKWEGGPYLHIQVGSSGMYMQSDRVRIIDDDQIAQAISDSGDLQIVAALPRHVCKMKISLDNILRGDVATEVVD